MPLDFSSLPVPGGFILACGLYAGASVVAGQVVAGRTIDLSGLIELCEDELESDHQTQVVPEPVVPETNCDDVIGWLHPDLYRLCYQLGNPDFAGPGAAATREAEKRLRDLENRQLQRAAAGAGSRCECAAAVYRRENLVSWGSMPGRAG